MTIPDNSTEIKVTPYSAGMAKLKLKNLVPVEHQNQSVSIKELSPVYAVCYIANAFDIYDTHLGHKFYQRITYWSNRNLTAGENMGEFNLVPRARNTIADAPVISTTKATVSKVYALTGTEENATAIISYITAGDGKDFMETVKELEELTGGASEHSERLRAIYSMLSSLGIEKEFVFDPSITRGLDYYTGIVYETFLNDLPGIGSVCSGGRYNNLASLYMKEATPGVGSSIGLDRLVAALEELGSPLLENTSTSDILIAPVTGKEAEALKKAEELRKKGFRVSMYLIPDAKMKKVYAFAESGKIPYLLTFNDEGTLIKDLRTRETVTESEMENNLA